MKLLNSSYIETLVRGMFYNGQSLFYWRSVLSELYLLELFSLSHCAMTSPSKRVCFAIENISQYRYRWTVGHFIWKMTHEQIPSRKSEVFEWKIYSRRKSSAEVTSCERGKVRFLEGNLFCDKQKLQLKYRSSDIHLFQAVNYPKNTH